MDMCDRTAKIESDLQKLVDILEKYDIHVTKTNMNGPVALANFKTNDIDTDSYFLSDEVLSDSQTPLNTDRTFFLREEEGNERTSICAFIVDSFDFEKNVEQYSKIYKNFSFYGLIYEKMYYLFDEKFYEFDQVSKIRGAFWKPIKDLQTQ